jgi:hypothetical protein
VVRGHGSIAEPALLGAKDRPAEFAMVVDRVASKPAPCENRRARHPQKITAVAALLRKGAPPARMNGAASRAHGTGSKNKPAQRGWAARQEKIQPKEKCFLLDSFYRTDQDLAAPPDRGVFTCARKSKAIVLMGAVKNACFGSQSAPWRKGIEL